MTTTPVIEADVPRIKLRSPADLVAAVPYLLRFHPTDSVVVIGFRDRRVVLAARGDLPDSIVSPELIARELLQAMDRQEVDAIAVLGYGPASEVDQPVRAIRDAADRRGRFVKDALRVDAGRWWSYLCEEPACCPTEGTPVELTASEVSARCAFEGLAAAPSRQDLARQVAPVDGPARASMSEATDRAEERLRGWLGSLPADRQAAAMLAEGTAAVNAAIMRYGDGGTLDDDELAWLSIVLISIPVRDVAWQAITTVEPHLRLWTDVTQRVDPALVAAPASLLAFAAWRSGDGTLAGLALERALGEDPSYSLAHTLLECLQRGLPPATLDGWGTPAWGERAEREQRRHRPARRKPKPRRRSPRRTSRRRT